MTILEWIENPTGYGSGIPAEYCNQDTVLEIIAMAMIEVRRDIAKARHLAKTALRIAKKIRNGTTLAHALRMMGHVYLLTGNSKRAVAFYEQAWDGFCDDSLEQANTAVAMVQALAYIGEYERSFQIGEEAIKIYREKNEDVKASRVQANIANTLHRLDRLDEARQNYQEALDVITDAKLQADLAIVMRNYGVCLMGLQLFGDAERMYVSARRVFEAEENSLLVLEIDLNQAYLLGRQGHVREALVAYRRLQTVLPEDCGFEIGHCLLDQADFMNEFGLYNDADQAAASAVEVFTRLDAKFELGKAKLMQGIALLRVGKMERSQKLIIDSKRLLFSNPNQNWKSIYFSVYSELLQKLGRPKAALRAAVSCLQYEFSDERRELILRRVISLQLENGLFDEAENLLESTSLYDLKSKLYRLRGQEVLAENFARNALQEFDSSRNQLTSFGLRRSQAIARDDALRECFRSLPSTRERFLVVTRIKANALAEAMQLTEDFGERKSETQLQNTIRDRGIALREFRDSEVLSLSSPLSSPCIPIIAPTSLAVELFCDLGRVIAFSLYDNEVTELDLGDVNSLQEICSLLRFNLSRDSKNGETLSLKCLTRLYEFFEPLFSNTPPNVVIAPDQSIANIPFQAMMVNDAPLYERTNLTLVPSIGVWSSIKEKPTPQHPVLLLAGSSDTLAPKISEELENLSILYQTSVLTTSKEVLSAAANADVIHLAAHGIVREDQPMFNAIQLADAEWNVLDFLKLRLKASLTILSGCSTGVSRVGDSMASEGFVESLLQSGSSAVVAALWDASDAVTAHWMVMFHRELQVTTPVEAHRRATSTIRQLNPHPMYWANFAVFGKTSEIFVSNRK